jgi:hypothetical protein
MAEFLSEHITRRKYLNPGESLEINFNVKNPGSVVATAHAKWDRTFPPDPTRRLLEIFGPGNTSPIAKRLDEGTAMVTFLSKAATTSNKGLWKARVTNKENSRELFRLSVSYPGTKQLKTLAVPISVINAFVNSTIKQVKIHLTDGTNRSSIKFPSSMSVPENKFTLPRYRHTFNLPWPIPDITVGERVNSINSSSVQANLANARTGYVFGSFNLDVAFETSGHEISGTVNANIGNMKLGVMLGIIVENGKITYQKNNIGVSFPITINLVNVPDILEDLIDGLTGFRNQIKNSVKSSIRNVFISNTTRQAITNALNSKIAPLLGSGAHIVSAKVQGGNLTIKYYND